ncbi:putative RNase H-like HicB family nuclease [Desulfomicrobium macestii]|uniref:RNase H-like HicB family nuclease n=1 Tax=Desulfomicrobium macestii TaxID=90731 RepID=A0ABR9H8X7_9BACT|nr:type II toxin-antitoxin system HicB family antitoxin [Desulfomicrobium macestii]MBE1427003.1 putative RNase H-like HicB family nuclease [Desulfomicrobium macestii]
MLKHGFTVLWSDEDNCFIATCPDFPGLSAFGESPEEALREANVALSLFLDEFQESGKNAPLPKTLVHNNYSGQTRLRMPKTLHKDLAESAENEGVSLNTWIIKLLSESNAISRVENKLECIARKQTIELATKVQKQNPEKSGTSFVLQQDFMYEQDLNGEDYGQAKTYIN